MHFSLLVITDKVTCIRNTRKIEAILEPFREEYNYSGTTELCTELVHHDGYPEEDCWRNPNGKWDWYEIGGRFHSRIVAKCGSTTLFDDIRHPDRLIRENAQSRIDQWRRMDDPAHRHDFAKVKDIISLNPDDFYSVLLPDGSWHDRETFHEVCGEDGFTDYDRSEWVDNEEWNNFSELFVDPYRNGKYAAIAIDYHI